MLADVGLGEAEAVGQDDRLAIFLENRRVVAARVMERHGEHAEVHRSFFVGGPEMAPPTPPRPAAPPPSRGAPRGPCAAPPPPTPRCRSPRGPVRPCRGGGCSAVRLRRAV